MNFSTISQKNLWKKWEKDREKQGKKGSYSCVSPRALKLNDH